MFTTNTKRGSFHRACARAQAVPFSPFALVRAEARWRPCAPFTSKRFCNGRSCPLSKLGEHASGVRRLVQIMRQSFRLFGSGRTAEMSPHALEGSLLPALRSRVEYNCAKFPLLRPPTVGCRAQPASIKERAPSGPRVSVPEHMPYVAGVRSFVC